MSYNTSELFESVLKELSRMHHVRSEDIPNIDLYMDQVTTFMDSHMSSFKRYPEDKVLTKTMINNYAKNNLLPSPTKKKYSRDHLLILIFIYYFKNILSIKDIEHLLKPLTEDFFEPGSEVSIADIYDTVAGTSAEQMDKLIRELNDTFEFSTDSFRPLLDKVGSEQEDYLQLFSLICSLSYEVYMKKLVIERLIDKLPVSEEPAKTKGKNGK